MSFAVTTLPWGTARTCRVETPTPSENTGLPFGRAGFASLCDALDYAARGNTGLNFFGARGEMLSRLPYDALRTEAQAFGRHLIGAGIDGRVVLISRQLGLPLTSSGKLSRSAAKATYLAGGYAAAS